MKHNRVYISCSRKDRALAAAVTELLVSGDAINLADIVSVPWDDEGLPAGVDFKGHLESKLGDAGAVVILLTPSYFTDRFCLCELGALWAMSKNVVPLLVPPLRYRDVKKFFPAQKPNKIDETDDLNKFAMELQAVLGWSNLNLPHWSVGKKKFLSVLQALLK